jgi:hypothetical protein
MPQLPKKKTTPSILPKDKASLKLFDKKIQKLAEPDKGLHFFEGRQVVSIANGLHIRKKAYEYVYKVYLDEGYLKNFNNNKMQITLYSALPDTTTLYAEDHNGNFIGTFTMVFDSEIGLPSDLQYKNEIDMLRQDNRRICEIISLGIDRAQRGSIRILAGLFYCSYLMAWHVMDYTDFIINVIPSHTNFYCKSMLFKQIGDIRQCPRTDGVPAVLLNLPISLARKLRTEKRVFPFSTHQYPEKEEIIQSEKLKKMLVPMSDVEFYTFFIENTDLWEKASDKQKAYIKKLYPIDQTDHFGISRALAKTVSKNNQAYDNKPE